MGEPVRQPQHGEVAEWSKALRSGRSLHSKAQVRILRGALKSSFVSSVGQRARGLATNRQVCGSRPGGDMSEGQWSSGMILL